MYLKQKMKATQEKYESPKICYLETVSENFSLLVFCGSCDSILSDEKGTFIISLITLKTKNNRSLMLKKNSDCWKE